MHRQQHASTKPVHCLEQLQYAAKRGFYFSTPKPGTGAGQKEVPPLPRDFIQVDSLRSRASVTCTTHKLNALNARLSDAATDCLDRAGLPASQQFHETLLLSFHDAPDIAVRANR